MPPKKVETNDQYQEQKKSFVINRAIKKDQRKRKTLICDCSREFRVDKSVDKGASKKCNNCQRKAIEKKFFWDKSRNKCFNCIECGH